MIAEDTALDVFVQPLRSFVEEELVHIILAVLNMFLT